MKTTFPVFRAGRYPQGTYSEEDVESLFKNYDPSFLAAPFTIDHKEDGPAYGYARVLKFENGTLFATRDDVSENLREAIKEMHFGRVSVEIYKDIESKGRYLKAISFLGVKAPQVKGLEGEIGKTDFRDVESEAIEFEVSWDADGFEGLQKKIADLEAEKQTLAKEKDDLSSKFQATETERRQAQEKLQSIEYNQRRLEFEHWLNARISYGSVTPAQKDRIMDILAALDSIDMFEQDGREVNGLASFKGFVESLPKVLEAGEQVTKAKSEKKPDTASAKEIANAAEEYQQEQAVLGRTISAVGAVKHVLNQRK